ncbi:hypothetical protein BGW37DRAFT_510485, partial [Umbelopsis sp. PMI_123]
MTSHNKLSKFFLWIKDDSMNGPSSDVRRNNSVHNKVVPSQNLKRQDHPPAYSERPTTKANGAIIVKTSDFLPTSSQAEPTVLKKRSHISLRSEDTATSVPMICVEIESVSSIATADMASDDKKEPREVAASNHLDNVEPDINHSHLVPDNQALMRDLDIARLQIKETQKRCDDARSLADSRQSEIEKLSASISTLRRLLCQQNANDDQQSDKDTNTTEFDIDHNSKEQKFMALIDEIETQQRNFNDLLEKHQRLTNDYGKLNLQQVENNEIIKELQREIATYQEDIDQYEVEKERMQSRLNNFLWEVNWVN